MAESVEFLCNPWFFPEAKDILCSRQVLVEEVIEIPCSKPDIEQLIDVKVQPVIESFKLIHTPVGKKVYVRGRLEQVILYVADEFCQPVHALNNIADFQTFIELNNCPSDIGMIQGHTPNILVEFAESVRVCPRSIRKNIILFIWFPRSIIIPPAPPVPPQPQPCPPPPLFPPQPLKIINQAFCEPIERIHFSPRKRKSFRTTRQEELEE